MDSVNKETLRNIDRFLPSDEEICVRKAVRLEGKGERLEPRFLVVTTRRLFILSPTKGGPKIEAALHFLSILAIESSKPELLVLVSTTGQTVYHVKDGDGDEIMANIVTALKSNLPTTPFEQLIRLNIEPADRLSGIKDLVSRATESVSGEHGPCGGFNIAYQFVCDYYQMAHQDEVQWHVDTVYHSNGVKELNLQDFDHLDPREFVPIVGVLAYNRWFTGFSYQGNKLTAEGFDTLARALQLSISLEQLKLANSGLNKDTIQKLAKAIESNTETALKTLDLSGNSLEDRGVNPLSTAIAILPNGLEQLRLSRVGLSSKGVGPLAQALKKNTYMSGSLKVLALSDNHLRPEGLQSLMDFLVEPNVIQHLDLSRTDCVLEHLFNGLLRGCCQHLQHLDLSHNLFTARKAREGAGDTRNTQLFFAKTQQLKVVKLSGCRLPAEALKAVMKGLNENDTISGLDLNISGNELNAAVLADGLGSVRCLGSLNISNNDLNENLPQICQSLSHCPSPLKRLAIGENFSGKRGNSASVEAVAKLISAENSTIESLSIADSRLRNVAASLLAVLPTNESLTELDISGNVIGDRCVRMLAKALRVNNTLKTVYWDNNGTTSVGFRDVASALQMNRTMLNMPTPVRDASVHLREKVELHLNEIQECLNRNHSVRRFEADQATRQQQQIMVSTTQQQAVDKVVVAIQDIMADLEAFEVEDNETVVQSKELIKDANKISQLLPTLHSHEVEDTIAETLKRDMQRLAMDLYQELDKTGLKETGLKIQKVAVSTCPAVVNEQLQDDIRAVLKEQHFVDSKFIVDLFLQGIGLDVVTKVCQVSYESAVQVSEVVVDQTVKQLEQQRKKLGTLLQEKETTRKAISNADSVDKTDDQGDRVDGPMMSRLIKHTLKRRPMSIQLDSPTLEREGPPLQHPGKFRPRGPTNRARPQRRPVSAHPLASGEVTSLDLFVAEEMEPIEEIDAGNLPNAETTKAPVAELAKSPVAKVAKPPVEVAKPSVEEVLKPSVTEAATPVAEATKPPIAEASKPPIAEVAKPPVAEVAKPPVTEVAKPPVMEVAKSPVTEVAKSPVTEVAKPPISEVAKPPVADVSKPPATEVAKPPVTEAGKPPRTAMKPSFMEVVKPPVSEVAKPPVAEVSKPPVTEVAKPAVTEAGKPPRTAMKPPISSERAQLNVKEQKDSRAKTLSAVPKNKAEEKKRGGSTFGFFKKNKSPDKSTPSKLAATQNEAKAADVQLPAEKQTNKQSGLGSENKTPSKAVTGPVAAIGAQLVAELKQKKVAGHGQSEKPATVHSVPEETVAEEKAEKPKPKPRFGAGPKIVQGMLAEMKDRQETKKNAGPAKPLPPVKPKPVSPKPARAQKEEAAEANRTPPSLMESNDEIKPPETAAVTQPSEVEAAKPDVKAGSPAEESTKQKDEPATLVSAKIGEEDSVQVETGGDQRPEELDTTGKGLEERQEDELPHEGKERAEEPQVSEDLSKGTATDVSEETEVDEKEAGVAGDGIKHGKLPSMQKRKERSESFEPIDDESTSSTDKADLGAGEEIATSGSTSRGSSNSDQPSDSPVKEPLKEGIPNDVTPVTTDSKEISHSGEVDESKKDMNQPETESGAACPSETDVVVTKELKSEEAPNGASGGGVDEYSDVVEV